LADEKAPVILLRAALVGLLLSVATFACATADEKPLKASVDAPPAGLAPTKTTLSDILAAHDRAVGTLPAGMLNTVVEHWTFVDAGLAGTMDLQRSGTNYHSRFVAGPFIEEFGQNADGRWHQNKNGFTSVTTGTDERTFYAIRVLEDAADPKNDVTVLGETVGAAPAYVLQVKRSGYRHPEFVFYDKVSGQIVRVERVVQTRRATETYDDFRTTDGVTAPWHVHDTDGRPLVDDDWTLKTIQQGAPIADSAFAKPPDRPTVPPVAVVTPIETHMFSFGFVVRLSVAGRGLDFLVDSSAPVSIIDRDVAGQLKLPAFGQTTQLPNGNPVTYDTVIDSATVGSGIVLRNFVVRAEDFEYEPDQKTRIVGVLGYDFFAANVLHFDFVHRTIEALPAASFADTAPVQGGIEVPLAINDGSPIVTIGLGSAGTSKGLLSIAEPLTVVLGSYVLAHPDDLKDVPGSKEHHTGQLVPFADDGTYGLTLDAWYSVVDLTFANATYSHVQILTTNYPLLLHDQGVDALIGVNCVQYFDLYFAYPHNRLIVRPNAAFYKVFAVHA
jgi:hypothetical protein